MILEDGTSLVIDEEDKSPAEEDEKEFEPTIEMMMNEVMLSLRRIRL